MASPCNHNDENLVNGNLGGGEPEKTPRLQQQQSATEKASRETAHAAVRQLDTAPASAVEGPASSEQESTNLLGLRQAWFDSLTLDDILPPPLARQTAGPSEGTFAVKPPDTPGAALVITPSPRAKSLLPTYLLHSSAKASPAATDEVPSPPRRQGPRAGGLAFSPHVGTPKAYPYASPQASRPVATTAEDLPSAALFPSPETQAPHNSPAGGAILSPHAPAFRRTPPDEVTVVVPDYEGLIGHAVESRNAVAAERFLRRMVSDYHAGSSPQVPNGRVYNQVLHSYAMVGNARHARDILKLMWNDYHRGNGQALPNQRCYTSCMYAWQKSSNKFEAPEQTEHLLREMYDLYASDKAPMCKPDVFCYTCVLHCWADSHRDDAVERATSLFRLMMERYEEGEKDLKPDNVVYSNLINVYIRAANDRNKAALLDRVEGIFWEMVEAHLQGNKKAAPSRRNFNTLLAAWSKESGPKYALKAEALIASWQALNKQKKVVETPDSYSYSLMLKAWANSNRKDAVDKILAAMKKLKRLAKNGDWAAGFDTIKYTTVLNALVKHGKAPRAHDLLLEMIHLHEYGGSKCKVTPNLAAFGAVMKAWACHEQDFMYAAKSCEFLFAQVRKEQVPPASLYKWLIQSFCRATAPVPAQELLYEMATYAFEGTLDEGPAAYLYKAVVDAWKRSDLDDKYREMARLAKDKHRFFYS